MIMDNGKFSLAPTESLKDIFSPCRPIFAILEGSVSIYFHTNIKPGQEKMILQRYLIN